MRALILASIFAAVMFGLVIAARHFGLLTRRGGGKPDGGVGVDESATAKNDGAALCRAREQLLTPAELNFFPVLRGVASQRWGVLAKVRLGDILTVPGQGSRQTAARNRIQQKHADFLLVDPGTTKPVLVVELDDASHQRQDRKDRDSFVNRACAAAGLPVLHVKARHAYAPAELARAIEEKLGAGVLSSSGGAGAQRVTPQATPR